ncbi:TIGR02556 family CRISPR-associated protein, partial [Clostridium disporicum]
EDKYDEVRKIIYEKIKNQGKYFFAVILKNGRYPYEIFKNKFLDKMYSTTYKRLPNKHICHFCGEEGEVFNTTTYKFYTNDKEVYGSIDDKEKFGVVICKNCLNDVLIGKKYVEDKLTTYWIGKNVMFIPHGFNEVLEDIYENSTLISYEKKNFISNISKDEDIVLEMLGKGNTETDIVFFEKDGNKTFYIYHTIKSMLPSRFGELANCLKKYKLKLYKIIEYSTAIKVGIKGIETTDKEKLRIVEAIFKGRKIQRNLFFTRTMIVYKQDYINGNSKFTSENIGKVYNFLVETGCLEGGFDVMTKYEDYTELFNNNPSYFNINEKKAWFLIGMAYNYINYRMKKQNSMEEGKLADKTSLDKNFFFARKFDFKDFIYFSNLLSNKIIKYHINSPWLNEIITDAKLLMANQNGKLSSDEAKYIFFWGMDSYFKKSYEKEGNNKEIENGEDN